MRKIIIWGLLISIIAVAQTTSAQPQAAGDWPHFNRDEASSRYSPLDEINTVNVSGLEPAWTYTPTTEAPHVVNAKGVEFAKALAKLNIPDVGGVGIKAVPVVVKGVMYVSAGNLVVAVDAASGKEIWRYTLADGAFASEYGVNYWPGNADVAPRIVFTSQHNLIALDAATGRPVPGFGRMGVVDMGRVAWRGVPVVFRNMLVVGANVVETPQDPNAPGDTRAFDAVTGAQKWVFHSVPRPGEAGHDTWLNDGWQDRSGTNVWGPHMTVDEELGLVYFPLGSPSANYYGGDRPGNNLFGNSVVAVDGNTGEYRWHFQLVHHDLWDYDNPPAPTLINIQRDGKNIPALAQIGKTGWMFILDRRTGEPIFGVDERPVAAGDVPGEWYAPTQPFPLKPGPLARMSFSVEDMVTAQDTNAAHASNCKALYDMSGGFYNAGPFTPFLLHKEGSPPRSTINFPGSMGGTGWGGMATDQKRGHVFVYTQNVGSIGWTMERKKGVYYPEYEEVNWTLPYARASVEGYGSHHLFATSAGEGLGDYPCQKPPWGQLNAVDANTGEIIWQKPVGIAEHLPESKRNTGLAYGYAGPTATAGGLLFFAGLSDGQFRAFNSLTGEELWNTDLGYSSITLPISFLGSDGRQYVSITVAGAVRAFALPQRAAGAAK
jgi:quinoprotein glucose dehydrogenase